MVLVLSSFRINLPKDMKILHNFKHLTSTQKTIAAGFFLVFILMGIGVSLFNFIR